MKRREEGIGKRRGDWKKRDDNLQGENRWWCGSTSRGFKANSLKSRASCTSLLIMYFRFLFGEAILLSFSVLFLVHFHVLAAHRG